jgi:hypothetical protein
MQGRQPDARPDEDVIYRELGRFVVAFQALANELFQLTSFSLDPEHAGHGRRALARVWFGDLVNRTWTNVNDFLNAHRGEDEEAEFRARLEALLAECRELARYRNSVVHSAYLFLEAADGELIGIVRSDMAEGDDGEVELNQELLTEKSFDDAMGKIGEVAFGIGQCRVQLVHWYRPARE